ncbi:hypothetical protein BUALT_Bualt04G0010500 [Buddleja alternifolia]|uniref:WAT1-related protein n=1 Tax=Buddleja alternifolia TaxID=168488 RepID=A0AAV6XS69_9LAMI|nr:hypothetical protein BUALT_Bualt04G0010500 [Buddleja alternifolia]
MAVAAAFSLDRRLAIFFFLISQAAATLFLAPIAIFMERKTAPPMSFSIFIKIFMLTLFGITMSLDIVGVALKYTSASLGAATSNTLPVVTFFLAVLLSFDQTLFGLKIVVCSQGPVDYRGLEGRVLKSYPSKLLLTTLQCFLSTIQSFIVAVVFTRDPTQWLLGFNIRLLSVAYCGIMVTGVTFYLQTWVIEKKGPVFLAMTTPLIMVFTIIISALVLGEIISLGSVLGALLLVGGLYFVLWGKTKEAEREKDASQPTGDIEKACSESKEDIVT